MLNNLRKKSRGFTIIEVLIVLAIAGLIMLIVFLAVPALQRNARNTQRRNDVAGLLGGIAEYVNNRNGQMPNAKADFQPNVKTGFYDIASPDVSYTKQASATSQTNSTNAGTVAIFTYAKCDPTGNGNAVAAGASSRSLVALFTVETGGGTQAQCVES